MKKVLQIVLVSLLSAALCFPSTAAALSWPSLSEWPVLSSEPALSAWAAVFAISPGSTSPIGCQPETDREAAERVLNTLVEGRRTFRYDTFGDQAFWGGVMGLHRAIAGQKLGGVGPGVSPKTALEVGLKVDSEALPGDLVDKIKSGQVSLEDPATTLTLLKYNAVVGVTGFFDKSGSLISMGIQCAICHSIVDNSVAPGIGRRLDGWANRDLNVGVIISLSPNLQVIADRLGTDLTTVRKALLSWGPGKFDAELLEDGKAFRPDGKAAATLLPPAFGLAGINLHTWTGWGSVPYWNAYVANTQMRGQGTFFDPRLNNPEQYPIAVKTGDWNIRNQPDLITAKLAALHVYQLALAAPKPPRGSFDQNAALRGEVLFRGKAGCSRCHVPPLYTEPGWGMHRYNEIGVDDFQAGRSPDKVFYRTSPLRGLWTHQKGGFYHDGRFANLGEVVEHYDQLFKLGLTAEEKSDLVQFLLSL